MRQVVNTLLFLVLFCFIIREVILFYNSSLDKMIKQSFIVAVFIIGAVWAQLDDDQSQAVDKALENLPPELQGQLNKDQVEELQNKTTAAFKDKCAKNGGADAYETAEKAFVNLKSCMVGLVNTSVLTQEIDGAKNEGKIDEVFKKYCQKKPQFKECFKDAVEAARPCFSSEEQKNLKTIYNVTEQLAEFVCFKDGDRIALFIAEGGPECFQSKQEVIQACVNSTLGTNVQLSADISAETIPDIKFTSKECNQLSALQTCVVQSLETCEQPTTANIVESLFKFIRKSTPCIDFPDTTSDKTKGQTGSASGLAVTSVTLIMAAATLLV